MSPVSASAMRGFGVRKAGLGASVRARTACAASTSNRVLEQSSKQLPTVELEVYRTRMLALTSVAGLCGLPQVNVPLAQTDEGPVGLSLVAARGADEMLLDTAVALAEVLQLNKK